MYLQAGLKDMDYLYKEGIIFTLDKGVKFIPAKRCLVTQKGSTIELSENNYRLLFLLLKGETDKNNLINQVWIEQRGSVSESSYYGQLYLLRKSFRLADLSESLIKTIPRKGVKYVGYVSKESTSEGLDDKSSVLDVTISDVSSLKNMKNKNSYISDPLHVEYKKSKKTTGEWYRSRSWNIFVSILAVIAVCWLTTLISVLYFLCIK